MKKHALLVLITLCILFSACTKDPQPPTVNEFSATKITISANVLKIDTAAFKAAAITTGFKSLATKDSLFVVGVENDPQTVTANLSIALKQKGAGTYKANEIKAYFYYTLGGDAITAGYILDPTAPDNQVIITRYDENNHLLQGTFNLTFRNVFLSYTSVTVKMVNGKINTRLSNQFLDSIKY